MTRKVVILGGGVAGMSAAHELIERGFDVTIYERQSMAGGKARSIEVVEPFYGNPSVGGRAFASPRYRARRPWLRGEHGFRFFPGFYRHIVDTMQRIPRSNGGCVADNLVDTTVCHIARFDKKAVMLPVRFPRTPRDVKTWLFTAIEWFGGQLEVQPEETAFFAERLWQFVTSCDERRLVEYEKIDWWAFIGAAERSSAYQKAFGNAITRSLVAAKAERASTKTIGDIFLQILFDIVDPSVSTADRVLNGPTNDVWINPWLDYLVSRGVEYHLDATVRAVHYDGARICGATISEAGRDREVHGDYFIAALPVERMADLVSTKMVSADPALGNLRELSEYVEWMNGIQYYLTEDVPIAHGHTMYVDSPWSLTSISQAQFWKDIDLTKYGDARVRGILSVDISNWDVAGLNGKQADECTRDEIAVETWRQLKRSLNVDGQEVLRDEQLYFWYLDPDIVDTEPSRPGIELNREPLLVNYADTWRLRPEATTRIPNLFLASDYVRTHTDLATMEAANEAARRAVNGVIEASGVGCEQCSIWPLYEPPIFAPFRAWDRIRLRQGLPWDARLLEISTIARDLVARLHALSPLSGTQAGSAEDAAMEALRERLQSSLTELIDLPGAVADRVVTPSSQVNECAALPSGLTDQTMGPGIRIVPR